MLETAGSATSMVDLVIGITVAEAVVLWTYHRFTGKGVAGRDFMLNLLSGLMLMVALRMHMAGTPWLVTAGLLAASGITHATDMWRRWRR